MLKTLVKLCILVFVFSVTSNCYARDVNNETSVKTTNEFITQKLFDLVKELDCYERYLSAGNGPVPFEDYCTKDIFAAYHWGIVENKYVIKYDEVENEYVICRVFKPNEIMKRGAMAEIFYTIICLLDPKEADIFVEDLEFADEADVIGVKRAAKYMVEKGYMELDKNNKFKPYDNITYGDFIGICNKIKKVYLKK